MSAPGLAEVVRDLHLGRRRERRRGLTVTAATLAVLLLGLSGEVLLGGSADLDLADVPTALVGRADGLAHFVVHETRLPRALTAALAGALLGLSGVVYQRLTSNVLATPDVIGISAGASAGAVAALVGVGAGTGAAGVAVQAGAVLGAALAAVVVFGLSWGRRSATYRLVLMGIGVGACATALTSYLLTLADATTSQRALRWMIGSLAGASWTDVRTAAAVLAAGVLAVLALDPVLRTLRLGDPLATALGTRVLVVRVCALLLGAVLAATATSVTGPVTFVALVAGPVAARLLPQPGPLLPGLVGACVLVLADVAAQSAPLVSPVPTGVVTGLVGAPVLVFLLISRRTDR
ncbi:FecCD family ABC transporter permease [Kineococcus sp. SYSU DK001]|uniref:FecCD family ABC transporter permease n=1 Tax=Kineococcus sp. SYSU DK001 TaxID=3383122 RepID=UPI003D7C3E07